MIGLNRKNYEARRRIIKMNVIKKAGLLVQNGVYLKLQDLNYFILKIDKESLEIKSS